MTTGPMATIILSMKSAPQDHEKLFNEICNKLNELGGQPSIHTSIETSGEKLENKLKKSHTDLQHYSAEMKQKQNEVLLLNNTLDSVHQQLSNALRKLENEKEQNHKLNNDLSKSLELSLKSQLELQEIKSKMNLQINEERKFSESLNERIKYLETELELAQTLRIEIKDQYDKAKAKWSVDDKNSQHKISQIENEMIQLQNNFLELDEKIVKFKILKNKAKLRFKNYHFELTQKHKTELRDLKELMNGHKEDFKNSKTLLEVTIQNQQVELREFANELDISRSDSQFKSSEIARLVGENSNLLVNLDRSKNEYFDKESQMMQKLNEQQNMIRTLEANMNQLRQERIKENQQYLTSLEHRDNEVQRLHQEVRKLNQNVSQAQATSKALNDRVQQLSFEKEQTEKRLQAMEEDRTKGQGMLDGVMTVAENKIVELKMAYDKKTAESSQMEKLLRNYQAQNDHLQMELSRLKNYIYTSHQQPPQKQL